MKGFKPIDGKRKRINVCLEPKTIKALDCVAEVFQTSRSELIELGICSVFKNAMEIIMDDIGKGGIAK
jgi:hypothetical protein